jgi:hypothetical protein
MKNNFLLSLMLLLFVVTQVQATEYTWTWNGSLGNNITTPGNWDISPAADANTAAMGYPRNLLGHTSVIVFNSSATVELPNPTPPSGTTSGLWSINEIRILSGNVTFKKTSVNNIDVLLDGVGLNISSGARLNILCDAIGIRLYMNASTNNSMISGTLDLTGTAPSGAAPSIEKYNFASPVMTVVSGGKIILSGLNAKITSTTATSLKFLSGSTLDITRDGGTIPAADYQAGSTTNVLGCITIATQFSNSYDKFAGDIIWNCPLQTATTFNAQWSLSPTFPTNFKGTFFMKAGYLRMIGSGLTTEMFGALDIQGGTFELGYASGTALPTVLGDVKVSGGNLRITSSDFSGNVTLLVNGNLIQSGGTINLSPALGVGILNVVGDVNQTAGTITEGGTSTTSALVFKGTAIQNATFLGTLSGDRLGVIINNGKKHVNLLSNALLPYRLQCTAGDMIIANNNLTVTEKVLGSRPAGGVVTNGTGTLTLKAVDNIGKDFPVKTSTASHDAVYITSASGVFDYSVRVSPTINPVANLVVANTIPRQWEIASTSPTANIEFDPDPIAGTTAVGTRRIGQYVSPTWVLSNAVIGVNNGYTYAGDFNTPYGSFVVGSTTAIPVELSSFTATAKGTSNIMDWKTATEINVAHFDIEKSADGATNWHKIGERKAVGSSSALNTYSFVDENPFAVSYYRLKTMDVDGKESISKVVSVKQANVKGTFKVFPQPVADVATIQLESTTNGAGNITVSDASGRVVLTQKAVYTEGSNSLSISTQNLASGLYLIRLDNGLTTITERFIKR